MYEPKEGYRYITPHGDINSLAPGRFQRYFRKVIFQLLLVIDGWSISGKIVLKWMPMDFTDGKSTLVQVKAWCHQATSHYLSQCWPRCLSPYGIIRPQWVHSLWPCDAISWHYRSRLTLAQVLPDGTKPLPEPMLTNHQSGLLAFTKGKFHKKCSRYPW